MKIDDGKLIPIKDWLPEDRPREKLLLKGISALSDSELIALLIRTGSANMSAVDVSKKILLLVNSLHDLARLSIKDLMKIKGIGNAKAIAIVAALELGRRRKEVDVNERPKVTSSQDAFNIIVGDLMDLPNEEFWVILLNRANKLIKKKRISEGGVSGTVADPKIIFKLAIEELASGIIVVHNHPSGNKTASESDKVLTRKLTAASKFLEIQLIDHLIVCGKEYLSFADENIL